MKSFDSIRPLLEKQYENAHYDESTGLSSEEIQQVFDEHLAANPEEPIILTRAFLMNLIYTRARFAIETEHPFAGKLVGKDVVDRFHWKIQRPMLNARIPEEEWLLARKLGCYFMIDASHVAPDWPMVLKLGLPGLRDRAAKAGETPFHRAVVTVYDGAIEFLKRCGKACHNETMLAVAEHAPQTLLEAFVLTYVFHELAELECIEVRSMGWFDRQFITYYRRDLAEGRLTRESAKELIKTYWLAFYAKYQGRRFGKNFCFGPDINELSYLAMECYYELNIVDPKLSVRVTPDTPQDFLELCCRNIRDGRNGIVMLNDEIVIKGLIKHGRTPEDARDYIPIGCYEPAVLGKEVALSGATHLYMPEVLQNFLGNGRQYSAFRDLFDDFKTALRESMDYMVAHQRICEEVWPHVHPAPFMSGTFAHCVETGRDYSEGGCVYNSTGCVVSYTAEVTDALAAIKYLVYDEKICTLDELRAAYAADWNGYEELRMVAQKRAPKYGNNDDRADWIAVELSRFIGPYLNQQANGRGGRMFASIYGQLVVPSGERTGALPNGRHAGEPVSKNMDACIGMDRNGITALMNTVLKIDMTDYPCGTCLDLMLHPSTVGGEEGITILASIIRTFIARGGSGLQFNIFDVNTLKDAQVHPENYSTLQVRVCGWNARFIDLETDEQNTFIAQADTLSK